MENMKMLNDKELAAAAGGWTSDEQTIRSAFADARIAFAEIEKMLLCDADTKENMRLIDHMMDICVQARFGGISCDTAMSQIQADLKAMPKSGKILARSVVSKLEIALY